MEVQIPRGEYNVYHRDFLNYDENGALEVCACCVGLLCALHCLTLFHSHQVSMWFRVTVSQLQAITRSLTLSH